jgi:DNA polymerase-3 subunit epsilon
VREIVLDTETTGVDAANGDRIVEIGCVELLNHIPTGRTWHVYLNPERSMPAGALQVHGLTDEFLRDKPLFAEVVGDFLAFVEGARLVAHNAQFDAAFLDAELGRLGRPPLDMDRVVDSLALARRRHPGAPNSLDALCSRYGIDNSRRTKHGALLDAEILAEVYIELIGGKQADLGLGSIIMRRPDAVGDVLSRERLTRTVPLKPRLTDEERAAHLAFLGTLGDAAIWRQYLEQPAG